MSARQQQKLLWLLETIDNNGPITLKEIKDKWEYSELFDGKSLATRTFHDNLDDIFDLYGVCIKCNGFNEYYIDDEESNRTSRWIIDSLAISTAINQAKELKDRIMLEDVPSGRKWLTLLLKALKSGCRAEITHKSFRKDEPTTRIMEPYFLQVHFKRWYLYARNCADGKILTLSLDRICDINLLGETFRYPAGFSPDDFLSMGYGASIYDDIKPETIRVKATAYASNFLRSLPLHSSQVEVESNNEYSVFEYCLPPVNEFFYDILHRGESVEIIYPESVRKKFVEIVGKLADRYKE